MAVAHDRSMNAELIEGATDGSIKKPAPNRGGVVDPHTTENRRNLASSVNGYGFGPFENPVAESNGTVRGT